MWQNGKNSTLTNFSLFYGLFSFLGAKNIKIPKSPNLLLYYLLVVVFGYLDWN